MNVKEITFIALLGSLANILFLISFYLGPIAPGASLDFSHIFIFVASVYGGPLIGFLTGLIGGILPGIYYGPLGACGWLGPIMLPIGKSLSGFSVGFLSKVFRVKQSRKSLVMIPLTLVSYIPECIFTVVVFVALLPVFIGGDVASLLSFLLVFVLPKAWAEIIFISFFMAALVGNTGFNSFVANFFGNQNANQRTENKA